MSSACFIINEWLLHDLHGDNGQEAREESHRFLILDQDDIKAIPADVRGLVPQKDLYLVETYYSTDANALVTTDQKLYAALSTAQNPSISVRLRDDFLKQYLESKS